MKIKFQYIWLLALVISIASCKKDNFDAPSSTLSGKVHYKGEALQLEQYKASYQMYQFGFGKVSSIDGSFTQEGNYSQILFDGQYKFIIPNGQGPFMWPKNAAGNPDSVTIDVSGNKTLDFEVVPYYMPRTPLVSSKGRNITASFKTEKIITGADAKNIEYVNVYINKTQFVSGAENIANRRYANDAIIDNNKIEFNKFIAPTTVLQGYYFVRMGIKIANVEDLIFTPVLNVNLGEIENYTRVEAENGTLVGGALKDSSAGSAGKFIKNISAVGGGVDITMNAVTAGNYVLNIGGGTDIKGSTQDVYIDGNLATVKSVLYPKQGAKSFDISPVEFTLTAGNHVVSIRKSATSVGEANIDYLDFFKIK